MFGTYRTILALMVVAQHLGGVHVIGGYAVFGFYVLSGYLMTFIMQNNYGYTLHGLSRYAANRFLRIYPIYWVSAIFSVTLILFLGEHISSDYHRALYLPSNNIEMLKNVLLFFPDRGFPRLTPPAWALTVEIFFYILIGLGLSKNKRLVLYWLAASIIYHAIAVILGLGWEKRYFTILAASLPFSTGAFIYHYKSRILKYISSIRGLTEEYLPFIIIGGILLNWLVGLLVGYSKGIFFYSNYVLCALMVVVLSERKTLPFITKYFDKWMGDFSYPIYLIHYQVGLVIIVLLGITGIEYKRPDFMLMLVSIPMIFMISWVFIVTLEKPIELLRCRVKKVNI